MCGLYFEERIESEKQSESNGNTIRWNELNASWLGGLEQCQKGWGHKVILCCQEPLQSKLQVIGKKLKLERGHLGRLYYMVRIAVGGCKDSKGIAPGVSPARERLMG